MEYIKMYVKEESGLAGRTVYGKDNPLPWTYATIEAANDYIEAHKTRI